jgi:hypothetical protein
LVEHTHWVRSQDDQPMVVTEAPGQPVSVPAEELAWWVRSGGQRPVFLLHRALIVDGDVLDVAPPGGEWWWGGHGGCSPGVDSQPVAGSPSRRSALTSSQPCRSGPPKVPGVTGHPRPVTLSAALRSFRQSTVLVLLI